MVKSYRYQDIQPSLGCPLIRGSVAHPRALVGTIQAYSWSRMMNLRPLLACNWGQYFTFPASDVWSKTIHTLARQATLTRMPRKMRLPYRLASYLRARFKNLLDVACWIWGHFLHAIRSNTFHFRPQINDTKRKKWFANTRMNSTQFKTKKTFFKK
jgi:hypothetical protein